MFQSLSLVSPTSYCLFMCWRHQRTPSTPFDSLGIHLLCGRWNWQHESSDNCCRKVELSRYTLDGLEIYLFGCDVTRVSRNDWYSSLESSCMKVTAQSEAIYKQQIKMQPFALGFYWLKTVEMQHFTWGYKEVTSVPLNSDRLLVLLSFRSWCLS